MSEASAEVGGFNAKDSSIRLREGPPRGRDINGSSKSNDSRAEGNDNMPVVKNGRGRPRKSQSAELQKEKVIKADAGGAGEQRLKIGGDAADNPVNRMRKGARQETDTNKPPISDASSDPMSSKSKSGAARYQISIVHTYVGSGKARKKANVGRVDIRIDKASGNGSTSRS